VTAPAERAAWLPPLIAGLVLLAVLAVGSALVVPWSVPGAGAVAVDWTRDFSPAEHDLANAFHARLRPPVYLGLAVALAVSALLGLTTLGARLVAAAAAPLGGGLLAQVVAGTVAVLLVVRLATLPLAAWREVVLRDAGLSTRTFGGWAADVARGFAVEAVVAVLAVAGIVAFARWLPRTWWVAAAAGAAVLVLVLSFGYPLLVEPLFNRFTPLPDGPLRSELLDLAERDGSPVDEVLVADASRRTSTLNAYVSGFGGSRRLVVYDTLLATLPEDEVRSVVAHELAHVRHRDVLVGTALGAAAAAAAVCLLAALAAGTGLVVRAGAASLADPRSLALLLALAALAGAVVTPIESLVSRRVEARADRHALDLSADPDALARLQRSLALRARSDLDPPAVVYALFATHPTAPERIGAARSWALANGRPVPADLVPTE
jgi:STE24 endopeptidase